MLDFEILLRKFIEDERPTGHQAVGKISMLQSLTQCYRSVLQSEGSQGPNLIACRPHPQRKNPNTCRYGSLDMRQSCVLAWIGGLGSEVDSRLVSP